LDLIAAKSRLNQSANNTMTNQTTAKKPYLRRNYLTTEYIYKIHIIFVLKKSVKTLYKEESKKTTNSFFKIIGRKLLNIVDKNY